MRGWRMRRRTRERIRGSLKAEEGKQSVQEEIRTKNGSSMNTEEKTNMDEVTTGTNMALEMNNGSKSKVGKRLIASSHRMRLSIVQREIR